MGVLGENVDINVIKEHHYWHPGGKSFGPTFGARGFSVLPEKIQKVANGARTAARKTAAGFKNTYGGVDNFWKVYSYEAELNKLKDAWAGQPGAPS